MEEKKHISNHLVDYFLSEETGQAMDPALAGWLEERESNKEDFETYKKIWEESRHYKDTKEFNTKEAWAKVQILNGKKQVSRRFLKNACYTLSGVAASLLVLLALSVVGIFEKQSEDVVSMEADYGNRSQVMLPDGSLIKLNAGSKVSYSYNVKEMAREVEFRGEGFFKVAKSRKPFVVKMANGLVVKVRGTSFNLQAYTEDEIVQASLVEGSIELNHGVDRLVMKPGEMAVFDKRTNEIKKVKGILSHSYGWLDNKLYMNNMSLAVVCKYLERWYDVEISLQPGLGESIHYNGVIQEETVTDVLEALTHLSSIQYQVKGKNIRITSK